jgi:predicted secreted Zn-dependent protease
MTTEIDERMQRRSQRTFPEPGIEILEARQPYLVSGTTPSEWQAPPLRDAALTEWRVRWRYRVTLVGERFGLSHVGARVDIVMRLPVWWPSTPEEEALMPTWEEFAAGCREREEGHAAIGVRAGRAAVAALRRAATQPTAALMRGRADEIARAVVAAHRCMARQHEARTR